MSSIIFLKHIWNDKLATAAGYEWSSCAENVYMNSAGNNVVATVKPVAKAISEKA